MGIGHCDSCTSTLPWLAVAHAPATTPHLQVKDDHLYIVVNAGCREKDLAHIGKHLSAFKARVWKPVASITLFDCAMPAAGQGSQRGHPYPR
jgi:hypothetical protein